MFFVLGGGADPRELLERVAKGDARALRALYDRFGGKVMALALRILRVRGEAEEVVQDVFVEVWVKAATFDPERGSAAAWILSTARNRAIDRLRSRLSNSRSLRAIRNDNGVAAGPSVSPESEAQSSEIRTRVGSALTTLPPEQRAVIELAFFDGLSQEEIARRTGHPVGTIKGRARAALAKLANALSPEER